MTTDTSPIVSFSQFIRTFVIHIIYAFLGPIGYPIMICLGTNNLLKNMGFIPTKSKIRWFVM